MKKLHILIITLVALVCGSCSQNHGYIGRIFGSWYLYDLTIDGITPDDFGKEEIFWSFQSDLIMISINKGYHAYDKAYGTFVETETTLTVNFTYSDPNHPAGTHTYDPPEILGWGFTEPATMEYVEKSKNAMTLSRVDDSGEVYIYYLRKTY